MSTHELNRRHLLRTGVLAGAGVLAARAALASACAEETPAQTEGPFYPVRSQSDTDWDLTVTPWSQGAPLGEQIFVRGTVTDQHCQPVAGALVEIWQACTSGRYN